MNSNLKWSRPPETPLLEKTQVHIWRGFTSTKLDPRLVDPLSEEEKQRADRFIRPRDRQNYYFSHTMLRIVLAHYLTIAPQYLEFKTNSYGKPRLWQADTEPDICFNMAHSEEMVAIAVTYRTPVGIDVEFMRELQGAHQIVTGNFSPEEQNYILSSPEQEFEDRFFTCWTLKEAFIKAIGLGLSHSLKTFSIIDPNTGTPRHGWVNLQNGTDTKWYQLPFQPLLNYRAAVVLKNIQLAPKFYDFNINSNCIIT